MVIQRKVILLMKKKAGHAKSVVVNNIMRSG
jgi:hypothetical protein